MGEIILKGSDLLSDSVTPFEFKMTTPLTIRQSLPPVLTLFLISPLIAEILVGSIPISQFSEFLRAVALYGSGALIIRETARRLHRGWLSIFVLGLVFGLIEEGLALQSMFNPDFFGLDISFGRANGVNWVWASFIIAFHAIWSISIPIWLSETIFSSKKQHSWLNLQALWGMIGLYLFMVFYYHLLFRQLTGFMASFTPYFSTVAIVVTLVFVILKLKLVKISALQLNSGLSVAAVVSFILALIWFMAFTTIFIGNASISPRLIIFIGVGILVLFAVLITSWANSDRWTELHSLRVVGGVLIAEMLYGALVLSESDKMWDRVSQWIFSAIMVAGLLLLRKKLKSNQDA